MAKAKYKKDAKGYYKTNVWDGTYTDTGRKHYVTLRSAKSSKDLENKVNAHNALIEQRKYVKKTDILLIDYARQWLKVYKASRAGNTKAMYDNIIEKHISYLDSLKLCDVSRIHYQTVLNNAEGKKRTQQQIAMTFKQVIRSAVSDQYLPASIMDTIFSSTESIKYKPNEKRPLTDYEKAAVFAADLDAKDKAFVYLLYGCGLRRGEALAVTRFNIDLKRRVLTVNQSVAFDGNNPYVKDTKSTNGLRSVPIPDKIFPVLESYVKGLKNEKLFSMKDGGWMTKSAYRRMWERIVSGMQDVSQEKITGLTAHIFRHNYCTNLCYQIPAVSIKKIAELLGDTEKMVMEVYNHMILEKEDAKKAVEDALNF